MQFRAIARACGVEKAIALTFGPPSNTSSDCISLAMCSWLHNGQLTRFDKLAKPWKPEDQASSKALRVRHTNDKLTLNNLTQYFD